MTPDSNYFGTIYVGILIGFFEETKTNFNNHKEGVSDASFKIVKKVVGAIFRLFDPGVILFTRVLTQAKQFRW